VASPPSILRIESLQKRFGGVQALGGVSLDIERGEFRAVIGPNGAGKSTLFNTVTGLHRPDGGQVFLEGRPVTGFAPHVLARMGIGRTFQITHIFPELSSLENVQVALLAHGRRTWNPWAAARRMERDRAQELLTLVGLTGGHDRSARTLSHGDKKRLELAIALASRPRLLLLDEPTAGMAAQERLESIRMLHRIAGELGLTVVFTEHDMAVVFEVASRLTVLHQGRVLAEGSPQAVRDNPEVQQVYLGESAVNEEDVDR
jgi:branched-chain amino acid transport system ATP-binding protein